MSKVTIQIMEGDTLPVIPVVWEDKDVTGYTLTLQVRQGPAETLTEVAGVIDDATAGEFHFQVAADDLTPGVWPARIKTISGTGDVETFGGFYLDVPEVWA